MSTPAFLERHSAIVSGILLIFFFFFMGTADAYEERHATREVLANGITLLHAERTALPIITVVVVIKGGSILESPEKAGLSNLVADLLNEGTTTRSASDISEAIEFVGGSLHASGGADFVTVSLSVLKKDIDLGLDLLSDIILNPAFKAQEIERQKNIMKNSIIQQNEEPGIVASKAFLKEVFGSHPYGWPVIGTVNSIDAITREDIIAFHKSTYVPNNAIVTVAGDIDHKMVRRLLDNYFSGWKQKAARLPSLPVPEPFDGPRVVKIQKDITQANIIFGHLGIKRSNPDYFAVSVMNFILGGGGFSSRLMDIIRDTKGLSYDVHSIFSSQKYGGNFHITLQTKNRSADTAVDIILSELKRIRTYPVLDKELNDAKSYLTGSFPLRIDSNSKMARYLTAVEYYGLGLDYASTYKKRIDAVSKDDVLRVAKKYLNTKNYVLVIVAHIEEAALTDR
jgi:zinc protease